MRRACVTFVFGLIVPAAAAAQPFETLGIRALGMGGAFVAVADDASAIWWNPAGLATGGIFSMGLEHEALDERSGSAILTGTPPLGFGYVRTRVDDVVPPSSPGNPAPTPLPASLVTHQASLALLQTLPAGLTVGTTVKFVRGLADIGPDEDLGRATNAFDLDAGALLVRGPWRLGLMVRNILEPEFEPTEGAPLGLERIARAGAAWLERDWTLALDVDLIAFATSPSPDALDDRRMVALGAERRWGRRLAARGGARFNTAGDERAPVVTVGFGIAVWGSVWVDTQVTGGSDAGDRGWGLAGRVHF